MTNVNYYTNGTTNVNYVIQHDLANVNYIRPQDLVNVNYI